jgi:hypothetical protein
VSIAQLGQWLVRWVIVPAAVTARCCSMLELAEILDL